MDDSLFLAGLGVINDDDFELAIENYIEPGQPAQLRATKYGRFNINALDERECLALFRFKKQDISLLQRLLNIPEEIITFLNA